MDDNQAYKSAVSPSVADVQSNKAESVEPPSDIALAEQIEPGNPTIEEYHEAEQEPYAKAYFDLGTPYEYLPEHLKKDMSSIDEFIEMEIQEKHWKSNLSNYHRVIEGLAAELDIREDELTTTEVVERIGAYAQSMLKLQGVNDIQKDLRKQLRRIRTRREANDLILKTIGRRIL